ncbi:MULTISPECIES: IS4 family transposase [unclassified Streptomyces]|uniref:IS4 family transposase n=1 Tax=unclassified Streptomyces TaxID=2593676 RepID=UPI000DAB9947|nr:MULTISPECIES: IS4 family transposase [unclassified Streptomyces]PZT73671.1 IS4 family transposase [Streptomyces sp. AC1-42T]PZT76773.1 IS4 family transposase [Streptomyces sp. AC1-42W]PZT79272.1 IS4 family transposase [Streptomyces sp. AC1-42T]PZT83336.1 IS4 family transposase [Streptomyces sp. AC1-42W]
MGVLSRTFTPELVDFVVDEAGAREERTRSLPARLMVYFVLTMWLFSGDGYGLVLRELVEHWPRRAREVWRPARTGSLTTARARLGAGPLRLLFDRVAGCTGTAATPGAFWRGLRLTSMDGTLLDVPDSEANAAAYTRASNGNRPGPYPQVRLLALVECGTKALIGAVFDSFAVGERTLAARLLVHLREGILLMADRGFPAYELWRAAAVTGAELLWRVSDSFTLRPHEVLADGTFLTRLNGPRGARITVRAVEYTVVTTTIGADGDSEETSELFCLITTLLDPEAAPAAELAELYTARWTSETIFKHIKIEQRGGRTATLRSNSPAMVEQELWAMLCVYQAVHDLAVDAAHHANLPVSHISFKNTLAAARRSVGADFPPSATDRQDP